MELKLACATALTFSSNVPGGNNFDDVEPLDPIERFEYLLHLIKTKSLLPCFYSLPVWEMRFIVGSWATN